MESWRFLRINHIIMITFSVQYDFPISPGAFINASVPSIKIDHNNLVTRQDPWNFETSRRPQDPGKTLAFLYKSKAIFFLDMLTISNLL